MSLYGPYNCSDGRKRVVHNGKTKLYARYLLEIKLGRELTSKENVHHVDGNFGNDDIKNLGVLLTSKHLKDHNQKYFSIEVTCVECNKNFMMDHIQHRNREGNRRAGRSLRGPFCSKKCSGKYARRNYWTGRD